MKVTLLLSTLVCTPYPASSISTYAKSLLGTPYIWGGQDSEVGLDCSGFLQVILDKAGYDPPGDQSAAALYNYFREETKGHTLEIPTEGALLFFGKELDNGILKIEHVAYALSGNQMIEAGGCGKECITPEDSRKKPAAEVRIRPIGSRNDLLSIIYPKKICK